MATTRLGAIKTVVTPPLRVPSDRQQYTDRDAEIESAIISRMGEEAQYLKRDIHEIIAEKANRAGITKSDPNWMAKLRNLQKVEFDNYQKAIAKFQAGYTHAQKQIEQEEKFRARQEAAQDKLEAKYSGAEARAIAQADKAIEREFPLTAPGQAQTPEQTAVMEDRYKRLLAKYKDLELMKVGLQPESQILKEVPYGSKRGLSEWVKNNQDKSMLQAYRDFATDPNYQYSEEDFREYPQLAKALAMIARGDTAPFQGNVPVRHLTDPNWKGTAERIYLNYQPSGKTVDQMIEEMKVEEAKSASSQPRAISATPSPNPQYTQEYINRADRVSNYVNRNAGAGDWAKNLLSGPPPEENPAVLSGVDTTPTEYPAWQKQVIDTAGAIGSGLYDSFRQIGNKAWDSLTNW